MKLNFPTKSKSHEERIREIGELIVNIDKDKIAFVILFGSFARGDWVRDRYGEGATIYEYVSDYDFLVITKGKRSSDGEGIHGSDLERKIHRELNLRKFDRRVPLSSNHDTTLVIEPLDYVNSELEKGRYFFSDIKKEGILLFASGEFELSEPKILSEKEVREVAREDWDHWFGRGKNFLKTFHLMFSEEQFTDAAFQLHQATESLYNCALLVLTNYKPKTHDLIKLGQLASAQSNQFLSIFPIPCKEQKSNHRNFTKDHIEQLYNSEQKEDWFKLLQMAYIDARYNKHFKIRKEQLEYLVGRVGMLKGVVEKACAEKI